MKLLLVKPDHLGDFAVTLPVLWELGARFGRENIRVLADGSNREWSALLPWLPPLEAVRHPRHARGGAEARAVAGDCLRAWRLRGERFDHGVELTSSRHDLWGKLWLALAGARRRSGLAGKFDFLLQERHDLGTGHQTARMAQRFPAEWGVTGTIDPAVFMPSQLRRQVGAEGVLIAPFAGQPAKEWAEASWMELIGRLRRAGREVSLIAGPDRRTEAEAFAARAGLEPRQVAVASSIRETLERLAGAGILLAPDTAVAHYAWLTGTPTVQLFAGTTEPERWGAKGALRLTFPTACAPCRLTACNQPGHPCLQGLDVETVEAAALSVLGKAQA